MCIQSVRDTKKVSVPRDLQEDLPIVAMCSVDGGVKRLVVVTDHRNIANALVEHGRLPLLPPPAFARAARLNLGAFKEPELIKYHHRAHEKQKEDAVRPTRLRTDAPAI